MKMKSKRRWLASLMAFFMLTSALPVTAFAEGHTHTEECYAKEGDLLCKISESEGHTHTSECVCPGGEYICGLEEIESHTHDESCYDYIEDEESGEEEATPSNAVQKKLVCGLEEQEGHTHTSECVCPGGEYICGLEEQEGHTHTSECVCPGDEYICGLEEIESHTHDESCYDYIEDEESGEEEATPSNAVQKKLVCGLEEQEGHTHTSECICPGGEIICGLEETEGHTHSEDCYAKGGELICGEEETEPYSSDNVYHVWFDGTIGVQELLKNSKDKKTYHPGMSAYYEGATDTHVAVTNGKVTLPETAGKTTKYGYTLNGWYDVYNGTYYGKDKLGTEIEVDKDTVDVV